MRRTRTRDHGSAHKYEGVELGGETLEFAMQSARYQFAGATLSIFNAITISQLFHYSANTASVSIHFQLKLIFICTVPRFEKEAQGNSELSFYLHNRSSRYPVFDRSLAPACAVYLLGSVPALKRSVV